MKNIYNYDVVPSQEELFVNDLTISNNLTLQGANNGLLEVLNQNVVDIPNGPDRYVLEIDQVTNRPAWTNNVKTDTLETNTLKINNTFEGDLLTFNSGGVDIVRLPLGTSGQLLVSNGLQPEWQNLIVPDPLVLNDVTIDNSLKITNEVKGIAFINNSKYVVSEDVQVLNFIDSGSAAFLSPVTNILVSSFFVNLVSGRRYRLNLSFIYSCTNTLVIRIPFNGGMPAKDLTANKPSNTLGDLFSHSYVFTSNTTSVVSFELRVTVLSGGTCGLSMGCWSLDPLL